MQFSADSLKLLLARCRSIVLSCTRDRSFEYKSLQTIRVASLRTIWIHFSADNLNALLVLCLSILLSRTRDRPFEYSPPNQQSWLTVSVPQKLHTATHCNTRQHLAMHCNTLQHTATHCNTLRYTATHCNTLQRTTSHCNTLYHTVTHYNTLHRTATYCNRPFAYTPPSQQSWSTVSVPRKNFLMGTVAFYKGLLDWFEGDPGFRV